jgi:hypothetical protein
MAYTVTQLITDAYYLSGVVSRQFQTVSGEQLNTGLIFLNSVLSFKTAQQRLIPYFQEYIFDEVTGQEKYFVPNLIKAETLTFNIGPVRYSMLPQSRKDYFGTGRVDNIQSLPYMWHYERTFGGSNIYMYFLPNSDYETKLWGKFSLNNVTLNQDLSLTLDQFYIEYLRYATGQKICTEYNISFPPENRSILNEYEAMITDISPLDLTLQKISSLQADAGLNWADINIGHYWRP